VTSCRGKWCVTARPGLPRADRPVRGLGSPSRSPAGSPRSRRRAAALEARSPRNRRRRRCLSARTGRRSTRVRRSTGGEPLREARTTSCRASSCLATSQPMVPVAPITTTFMVRADGPGRSTASAAIAVPPLLRTCSRSSRARGAAATASLRLRSPSCTPAPIASSWAGCRMRRRRAGGRRPARASSRPCASRRCTARRTRSAHRRAPRWAGSRAGSAPRRPRAGRGSRRRSTRCRSRRARSAAARSSASRSPRP